MEELDYETPFSKAILNLESEIARWFAGPKKRPPQIEDFEEPVYFKSSNGVLVHSNSAYRDFFPVAFPQQEELQLHSSTTQLSLSLKTQTH